MKKPKSTRGEVKRFLERIRKHPVLRDAMLFVISALLPKEKINLAIVDTKNGIENMIKKLLIGLKTMEMQHHNNLKPF